MQANHPIGIFDSGIGGTSIFKEIHALLPLEHCIYLADSANAPYGLKSKSEIIDLSFKNTDYLLRRGCKIIVVACNTATTNAIAELRAHYSVPFIGIEPAIKPAALHSTKKSIGILATKGTLASQLFTKTAQRFTQDVATIEVEGNGLVKAIEAGNLNTPETFALLKTVITPILEADIDYLVLGCTHYPYLIPLLRQLLPPHVKIIDSGEAVARQTKAVLAQKGLLTHSQQRPCEFYSNKNPRIIQEFIRGEKFIIDYLDF